MTKRRSAINKDALDALFSTPAPRGTEAIIPARQAPGTPERPPRRKGNANAQRREAAQAAPSPEADRSRRKVKATYLLPAEIVAEARDAVVALSGPPARLTLALLVENALRRELDRLRKQHTGGNPFPKHAAPLVGGRPIGS